MTSYFLVDGAPDLPYSHIFLRAHSTGTDGGSEFGTAQGSIQEDTISTRYSWASLWRHVLYVLY